MPIAIIPDTCIFDLKRQGGRDEVKTSVRKIILIIISCILDVLVIPAPVIIYRALDSGHYASEFISEYIMRPAALIIGLPLIRDTAHMSLK